MFQLDTVNELYCRCTSFDGQGKVFTKVGSMAGFRGDAKFKKLLLGPEGNPLQAVVGQLGRRVTGENMPLMAVEPVGECEVMLANLSQHVSIVPLQPGLTLKVESENLLAFNDCCKYGWKFFAKGIISQKGLFISELKIQYEGAQVAILTDGNPLQLETPCCVDPDVLVAWTGPDPNVRFDLGLRNVLGRAGASGESYMFQFTQPGFQVVIQPTERKSGVNIGIDGNGYAPDIQQNQGIGDMIGHTGDVAGQVGNMLGGLFGRQ